MAPTWDPSFHGIGGNILADYLGHHVGYFARDWHGADLGVFLISRALHHASDRLFVIAGTFAALIVATAHKGGVHFYGAGI